MGQRSWYKSDSGHWKKLTEDDIRVIRKLYADGWTFNRIAYRYGISAEHVSKIVRRQSWSHVD